jgi:hypothetical protein
MATLVHSILIQFDLTNSNDGQGRAWYRTAALRTAIERELRLHGHERDPFDFPVSLRLTRVLGKKQRLWDADSVLRGSAKQLIDSLVAVGWFHDDGPKWILNVRGEQDDTRREIGPAVLIEVFENGF